MAQTRELHSTVALDELREHRQWVAWEYDEKQKVPINPITVKSAKPNDPSMWATYEEALAASVNGQIGFVLTSEDDFAFVDLDHCINLETGEVALWALEIVEELDSYTELSPSGTGMHILVKGHKPSNDRCSTQYGDGKVEVYDERRFFTLTGSRFSGYQIEERQDELERLYHRLLPKTDNQVINTVGVGSSGLTLSDEELLDKARNANGTGRLLTRLYDYGDTSKYSYDDSRADMAQCGMLAYWTACDEERMDRLFRGSKLMRPKWDERRGNSTYGERTIARANKGCKNVYDPANYKAQANDDVLRMLEGCTGLAMSGKWSGRSGPTDRDVYKALISTGLKYGKVVANGVEVRASERDVASNVAVGKKAAWNALQRLENRGLIRKVDCGGRGKAAKYILLTRTEVINNRVNTMTPFRVNTQKVRNPGRTYGTIGKRNGQIIDFVYSLGRVVSLKELAVHFDVRRNSLKSRNINVLLELGLLEENDNGYVTPADIEDRLERELKESGCEEAEKLQAEAYERERKAWREMGKASIPTVSITGYFPDTERDYLTEDETCIHGIKELCYLHNPNHPYRLKEKQEMAA
jgi:putative DNA primase/helicase